MDKDFLWYGISIIVNDILATNDIFIEDIKISKLDTTIENNIFNYSFILNEYECSVVYIFDSNVITEGILKISCNGVSDDRVYNIVRGMNHIKVECGLTSYHELYCYNKTNYMDIFINALRKQEVTNINITSKPNSKVIRANTHTSFMRNYQFKHANNDIYRILFAMSGVIDHECKDCRDVVVISGACTKMVIYDNGKFQVICVDIQDDRKKLTGSIIPTNSDFKQTFEYSINDGICHVIEYMDTSEHINSIRREYDIKFDGNCLIANDETFIIKHNENDVSFVNCK